MFLFPNIRLKYLIVLFYVGCQFGTAIFINVYDFEI